MGVRDKLLAVGLRPTKQRLVIGEILLDDVHRHFTAEDLHKELTHKDAGIALATIYNTLGAFTEAGLLRTVSVDSERVYYDTNTDPHYHVYEEDGSKLTDIDASRISIQGIPDLPQGQVVDRIDVIIRTRST